MSQSEIARLRQQIAAEYTAAYRALYEYATVAKHEIITYRFNQAGLYTEELARFVGKEEAEEIAAQIYMQFEAEESTQEDQTVACSQAQASQVREDTVTIRDQLKWDGTQFLRGYDCDFEHYAIGDVFIF